MILPYQVNTLTARTPWANFFLLAANLVMFLMQRADGFSDEWLERLVLHDWSPLGLLGHQFLHVGWMHFLGNMMALWVFGNAINGVLSDLEYLGAYLLSGVLAGAAHLLLDGAPAVGASGAIAGVMAMYLAIYPKNEITCWYWFFHPGTFEVKGYIYIVIWFIWEVTSALRGVPGIASWAHVGGAVAGFGAGLLLLKWQRVHRGDYDHPTLPELFSRSEPE